MLWIFTSDTSFNIYIQFAFQNTQTFGVLVQKLRLNPKLLACCLAAGDRLLTSRMPEVINCTLSGIFGSCLMAEDNVLILRLLRHLAVLQLIPADNPQRLAFSIVLII